VLSGAVSLGEAAYPPGSCFWIPAGTPAHALASITGAELFAVSLPRYAP
jgi:hypothetical protein